MKMAEHKDCNLIPFPSRPPSPTPPPPREIARRLMEDMKAREQTWVYSRAEPRFALVCKTKLNVPQQKYHEKLLCRRGMKLRLMSMSDK